MLVSQTNDESFHASEFCWSVDGTRLFLVNNHDSSVEVRDCQTMERVGFLARHADSIDGIVVSPDGRFVATGSYDGSIHVSSATDYEHSVTLGEHPSRVTGIAFSDDSRFLAGVGILATTGDNIIVWNTEGFGVASRMRSRFDISSAWFSKDGDRLLTYNRYAMEVWDVTEESRLSEVDRQGYQLDLAEFSEDEEFAITLEYEDRPIPRLVMFEKVSHESEE